MDLTTPQALRKSCKEGLYVDQTSGLCPGFVQANLCILPSEYAFDFLLFCQRNPKPCPLLYVCEAGQFNFDAKAAVNNVKIASCSREEEEKIHLIDIRTDLPKYRYFIDGQLKEELPDITSLWRDDLVTFVIGCSFSFEEALMKNGLSIRHIEMGSNHTVPMYKTNIPCPSAGRFAGNMVVSMRPYSPSDAILATEITSRYPRVHGSPVYIGDPSVIGIADISKPDFGDAVEIKPGEVPVFWACGVTPQAVVMTSKPPFCITHAPGHMLVLDSLNDELAS